MNNTHLKFESFPFLVHAYRSRYYRPGIKKMENRSCYIGSNSVWALKICLFSGLKMGCAIDLDWGIPGYRSIPGLGSKSRSADVILNKSHSCGNCTWRSHMIPGVESNGSLTWSCWPKPPFIYIFLYLGVLRSSYSWYCIAQYYGILGWH